jgi:type IV pilus assembly protein PilW
MTIKTKHARSQCGLTLIELMIALLISSILMFGVGTIYVSSKRGYNIQDNLARQQENSRFSVELLVHDLRMAGYPKRYVSSPIVTGSTADGGGTANDTVTVEYLGNTDCLGQNTPANSCSADPTQRCAINTYSIKHDAGTNTDNLYCQGNGGANAEIIADNVTNMQVLYGIDTDTNGDGIANKYVTWPSASADPSKIVNVRFALLTQTPNEVKKAQTTKIYSLLDQKITINNDRHFHRVYMNTVQLRNQMN